MGHYPATTKGKEVMTAADAAAVRTAAGTGTIATQNANNVTISGGAVSGVTLAGEDAFDLTPQVFTADHVLDSDDVFVIGNHATVPINFDLPPASGSGKKYIAKRIGAAATTVTPDGTDQVDGANSAYSLAVNESITLVDSISGKWSLI